MKGAKNNPPFAPLELAPTAFFAHLAAATAAATGLGAATRVASAASARLSAAAARFISAHFAAAPLIAAAASIHVSATTLPLTPAHLAMVCVTTPVGVAIAIAIPAMVDVPVPLTAMIDIAMIAVAAIHVAAIAVAMFTNVPMIAMIATLELMTMTLVPDPAAAPAQAATPRIAAPVKARSTPAIFIKTVFATVPEEDLRFLDERWRGARRPAHGRSHGARGARSRQQERRRQYFQHMLH